MCSVRISLGKVVKKNRWKVMLHHLFKQMTRMKWVGTRAFNHFVIFAVLNGEFEIKDDKVLSSVIRACFTITEHMHPPFMLKSEIGERWCKQFLKLYQNREIIDKTSTGNTIAHYSNEHMFSVKNYLVYDLRNRYVRLLKS